MTLECRDAHGCDGNRCGRDAVRLEPDAGHLWRESLAAEIGAVGMVNDSDAAIIVKWTEGE
jgi:hypothetical protein